MGDQASTRQHFVAGMTWQDVLRRLAGGAVAIVPVGAGAKQHGLHMPMATDKIQAEWFAAQLSARLNAIVWPTLTYGSYPAFVAYAGSVSLSEDTFVALVKEVVEGLIGYNARRVFILNTGVSTIEPIDAALARVGATDRVHQLSIYSGDRYQRAVSALSQQKHGSHADEIETSIMLAMAPSFVKTALAQASPPLIDGPKSGSLSPDDATSENYSPGGSFGDPTLASLEKGRALIEAILSDLVEAASRNQ